MQGKSQKGAYTILALSIIAAAIILLVFGVTKSDVFTSDKDLLTKEAGKVTITAFKEDCKYYGMPELTENIKELKNQPCAYRGILEKIEYNTFGDCTAYVRVKVAEDEESKINTEEYTPSIDKSNFYYYVVVSLKEKSDISAALKNTVDVYGYIDKLSTYENVKALEVKGVKIMKIEENK